jgi:hypothetical protein
VNGKFHDQQRAVNVGGALTKVEVGGPLGDAGDLAIELKVIVVDQLGVTAEGTASRVGQDEWAGYVSVRDAKDGLTLGPAIGYALAIGTGDGGITTYQWHHRVELV